MQNSITSQYRTLYKIMSKNIIVLLGLAFLMTGCTGPNVKVFDNSTLTFEKYVVNKSPNKEESKYFGPVQKKKVEAKKKVVLKDLKNHKFVWKTKYMEIIVVLHENGRYSSKNVNNAFQKLRPNGSWEIKNQVLKLTSGEGAVSLFNEPKVGDSYAGIYGTHGALLRLYK
jgi:hypothetical protein